MGLWAEAVVRVPEPKQVNIKKLVLDVLKEYDTLDEVIVDSSYSKEEGVCVGIRTDCYLGDTFNTILMAISKEQKDMTATKWMFILEIILIQLKYL